MSEPHDATAGHLVTARRQTAAWVAVVAIAVAAAMMIMVSAGGPNLSVPVVRGAAHPPWWHPLHLSNTATVISMWIATALGCAGVVAGLASVAKGARLPVWLLPALGAAATLILTVLPPGGSTDSLSYAANGRMLVIGHSPYVMTPLQLGHTGDPIGLQLHRSIPALWNNTVSVYGPVATGAEWVAAKLGGVSLAHIVFWLKLLEAICFLAVAFVLDRMLRHDPAMRLRAHLLWTANPLLLWEIVAGGHIDGLSAVFGLLAIAVLRARDGQPPTWTAAMASGAFVALATGVKVEYALLGLAVAWACRRQIRLLAAAAAGFLVLTIPAFAVAGAPAIKVLFTRSGGVTWDTMYQLFWRPVLGYTNFSTGNPLPPHLVQIAYVLFAAVAILAVLRMPVRTPELPALAPALALSLAWLFLTPFQRPWYDVMAICLLAVYSASLLDYAVVGRLLAGATVYVIAVDWSKQPHWLANVLQFDGTWLTPAIRLLATVALIWLCVSGRWGWRSSYPQGLSVDSAPSEAAGNKLPLAT